MSTESLERGLGRIEGRVETVLVKIELFVEQQKVHADLISAVEKRTTELEKWQSRVLGGATVLGVVGGIIAKVFL